MAEGADEVSQDETSLHEESRARTSGIYQSIKS